MSTEENCTYVLLPNGGSGSSKKYLVMHQKTGWTMPYMIRDDLIQDWINKNTAISVYFFTFQAWSERAKKRWRRQQEKTPEYKRLLEDKMSWNEEDCEDDLDCDCVICDPQLYLKENNMNYAAAVNTSPTPTDQRQRDYLISRLTDLEEQKTSEMYKFFRLDPVDAPRSFNEMMEKIKAGEITYNGRDKDYKHYNFSSMTCNLRWAKEPADHDGYNAAIKKMEDASTKTKDAIIIKSPEDGLKALEAFESQTFH